MLQHIRLLLFILFGYNTLRIPGVILGKMGYVDNAVFKHRIIYIINCDQYGRTAGIFLRHIFLYVSDTGHKNTRYLLFQNIVGGRLKFRIHRQINIVSGSGFHIVRGFDHLSEAVHVDDF